jgi:ABC-type multidrug transport system ATPase subunit
LANRIAVVDHGRIIADDTPTRLKSQLGNTVVDMGCTATGALVGLWSCCRTGSAIAFSARAKDSA